MLIPLLCLSLTVPPPAAPPSGAARPARREVAAPESTHAWADVDGDDLPDLLALRADGSLALLRNAGDGSFEDARAMLDLAPTLEVAGARWIDFDADGRIDLFAWSTAGAPYLLQNVAGADLVDVTDAVGLSVAGVRAAQWHDYDLDGRIDVVLTTTGGPAVFHATRSATFERVALPALAGPPAAGSGAPLPAAVVEDGAPTAGPTSDAGTARPADRPADRREPDRARRSPVDAAPAARASGERVAAGTSLRVGASSQTPLWPQCAATIDDQAGPGCLAASSAPVLGSLHPLSVDLNVTPAGRVGIGTTAPSAKLQVAPGNLTGIWSSGNSYAGRFDTSHATLPALRADGAVAGFFDGRLNVGYNFMGLDVPRVALSNHPTIFGGVIEAFGTGGNRTFHVQGSESTSDGGQMSLATIDGTETIVFDAEESGLGAAAVMRMTNGTTTVRIDAEEAASNGAQIALANANGDNTMVLDANTSTGGSQFALYMVNGTKTVEILSEESGFNGGQIEMWNALGNRTVQLDANTQATGGSILYLYDLNGVPTVEIEADENLGNGAQIALRKVDGTASIVLDADHNGSGRVITEVLEITGGADLVESFEAGGVELEPGTVVVADAAHPGRLARSAGAYDRAVVGVVSGANGVLPGLHLAQQGVLDGDVPVALSGRVYVRATTENGAIRPGDLLTTASLAGHAMRASDPERSFGSVLGKALSALDAETGLVLVLVSLQ